MSPFRSMLAQMHDRLAAGSAVALVVVMCLGCGRGPEPAQCTATGIVLAGMKPAPDVCLRFHAKDDPQRMLVPEAVWTDADGGYTLPVKLPGAYAITAYWPTVRFVDGERIEGEDRLRGKFSNVHSPLRTITLTPGENDIPLINLHQP